MNVHRSTLVIYLFVTLTIVLAKDYTWGDRIPGDYRMIKHSIKVPGAPKKVTRTRGTFIISVNNSFINYMKLTDNSRRKTCQVSITGGGLTNVTFSFEDPSGHPIDYLAEIYIKSLPL